MELIILAVLLLIVIAISIVAWMNFAKTRQKMSENQTPPAFQQNSPSNFPTPKNVRESRPVKRCPTCQSTFTDQNLAFCLSDGTPLQLVFAAPIEDDLPATIQSPNFENKR